MVVEHFIVSVSTSVFIYSKKKLLHLFHSVLLFCIFIASINICLHLLHKCLLHLLHFIVFYCFAFLLIWIMVVTLCYGLFEMKLFR